MAINFVIKAFSDLELRELYDICAVRQEVFVLEQNCCYLDADGKDVRGYHLMGIDAKNSLVAYCRLLPKGVSYDKYCSIGRVLTTKDVRGKGIGRDLMIHAIEHCQSLWKGESIKISAQSHLEDFYSSLGFISLEERYLEDKIPHVAMVRQ